MDFQLKSPHVSSFSGPSERADGTYRKVKFIQRFLSSGSGIKFTVQLQHHPASGSPALVPVSNFCCPSTTRMRHRYHSGPGGLKSSPFSGSVRKIKALLRSISRAIQQFNDNQDQEATEWAQREENQSETQSTQQNVSRVILLLDLDCYEAQVWIKKIRPKLLKQDIPIVVVNHDQIIIAVNYTAKARGVTRGKGRKGLREAWGLCPNLKVLQIPERYGKVDTFYPYKESDRILHAIQASLAKTYLGDSVVIERSSNDEIYLDVTAYAEAMARVTGNGSRRIPSDTATLVYSTKQNPCLQHRGKPRLVMQVRKRKISNRTLEHRIEQVYTNPSYQGRYPQHVNELLLVHGAFLAEQIIRHIKRKTRYHCSAGVASNKLLAKLASSSNKPEGICIITDASLPRIFKSRDFRDIPGFRSKQGNELTMEFMKPKYGLPQKKTNRTNPSFTIFDVQQLDQATIHEALCAISAGQESEKSALLYAACRGKYDDSVTHKVHRDNMSTSLSFRGSHKCRNWADLYDRIDDLALDMEERLDYTTRQIGRQMRTMTVKVSMRGGGRYDGPSGIEIPYDGSDYVHRKKLRRFAKLVAAGIKANYQMLEGVTFQAKDVIEVD